MKKEIKTKWIIALCLILFAGIISACKTETDDNSRPAEATITFDANDGSITTTTQTVTINQATALVSAKTLGLVRENHPFVGWNTRADGSGSSYSDAAEITLTDDLVLYAQWGEYYSLKTGREINDIFKNTEKLNASEATAFAKSTEPPASATYYLDTDESCIPVWYDADSKTIYYYAPENRKLILNADSSSMFYFMPKLVSIDTSDWDTANVTTMSSMFDYCKSLSSLDVSGFNTANVRNMNYMFYNCSSLGSLDVSGFDTSNVTAMGGMFKSCSSLSSLDLSGFDTSNVTNMERMFYDCSSLTTISVASDTDWSTSEALTNSSDMFEECTSLVGEKGTTFSKTDATYACVDGLNGKPGYFTAKSASQE